MASCQPESEVRAILLRTASVLSVLGLVSEAGFWVSLGTQQPAMAPCQPGAEVRAVLMRTASVLSVLGLVPEPVWWALRASLVSAKPGNSSVMFRSTAP